MPKAGAIARPLAVIMSRELRTISPEATLVDAATLMRSAAVGALLVREREEYVGIVTEPDLVRKAMAVGLDPRAERVRKIMSSPIITIDIDRSPHDASDVMAEHGIRHLAITEDARIVGIISVRDLLRYFKNWGAM